MLTTHSFTPIPNDGTGEDGSMTLKISSQPEDGNWLNTPGDKMVILIRVYRADSKKIGDYVPPSFMKK